MVTIGRTFQTNEKLYEIIRVVKVKPGANLPKEHTDTLKSAFVAEKCFKHGDEYWFVNEIQDVEPILDQEAQEDIAKGDSDLEHRDNESPIQEG